MAESVAAEDVDAEGDDPPDDEGRPSLDEEERASADGIDLGDLTDDVMEAAGTPETDDTGDADDGGESDETDGETEPSDVDEEAPESIGDVYAGLLAVVTAAVVASQNEDVTVEEKADDVLAMTTLGPFDLARDVDRLMEQRGGGTELPPHIAVLAGSVVVFAAVVLTETDLGEKAVDRLMDDFDGFDQFL